MIAIRIGRVLTVVSMILLSVPTFGSAAVVLGDISFDNKIGIEEAISSLKIASDVLDPNVLDVASMQSAYGTYSFDDSTNNLSILLTHSNIPRSMGPPVGETWGGVVSFPDANTMILSGMTFLRRSVGTGSVITGVWEVTDQQNALFRIFVSSAENSILFVRYADYYSTLLNKKTININGDFSDWNISDRVYTDTDGPECNNVTGQDIQEIYMTQDNDYLYIRYKLNGSPDTDFGYKFGANLHTYVGKDKSTGDAFIMWATPVGMSMGLPSGNVAIVGSDIEFRVDLCQPGWNRVSLSAWLDDHDFLTGETTCNDHVDLPYVLVDVSGCP